MQMSVDGVSWPGGYIVVVGGVVASKPRQLAYLGVGVRRPRVGIDEMLLTAETALETCSFLITRQLPAYSKCSLITIAL